MFLGMHLFSDIWLQGATDFIFGARGLAYFGGNTIGVKGPGWVTASGRDSDDDTSCELDLGLKTPITNLF